ncbi:MAG: hypothetical protein KF901_25030 [Myxococcales bacterium]|nr:hypothetical protein [Myxococcales bacterium]
MDPVALADLREPLWYYVVTPILGLAALVLTIRLRAPQWRRFADGVRAVRGGGGEGVSPGQAATLATVTAFAAASAVGAMTAVTLGGAGTLPWLWLFGIVLAPLRYAEVWLARTDAPGKSGGDVEVTGSLARRFFRMGDRWRLVGALVAALAVGAGFAWGGGANGDALARVTEIVLPGSTLALVGGAAVVGAVLAVGGSRTLPIAGWLGAAGLVALVVAALWGFASDPGGCFAVLGRAFADALEGAPQIDHWTGAFAGEIARASVAYMLVPLAAPTGVSGALHSLAGGKTRDQAALAVLGPFFCAVAATLLVMVGVGSGALGTRVEGQRALMEDTRIYRIAAESASQRAESDRLYDGMERILEGESRNPTISVGTARGMVHEPRFVQMKEGALVPADIALRMVKGRPDRILVPGRYGALQEADLALLNDVYVTGQMLPDGAGLLAASLEAAHDLAPRLLLAALLALAAVAFGAWGAGVARSLSAKLPPPVRIGAALLPAIGGGLAATGLTPWIAPLGALLAGALVTLSALLLLVRAGEIAKLDR